MKRTAAQVLYFLVKFEDNLSPIWTDVDLLLSVATTSIEVPDKNETEFDDKAEIPECMEDEN